VGEIRLVGRNTQGVRVMNLNDGDKIVSLAKVARDSLGDTTAVQQDTEPNA
jgi:DNA gyrase subunit A